MSKSQFTKAQEIFDNRNEIIEKYTYFDSDREEFIKDLKLDESNTAQFIVFLLMAFNKKNIKIESKNTKATISERILSKIKKSGNKGISLAVIYNVFRNKKIDEINESMNVLINDKKIFHINVEPVRGATTKKYFYKDYLQN